MKYIQPMTWHEFANHLYTLTDVEDILFGCDPGCAYPNEVPDPNDVSAWYFARLMHVREYDCNFILIDYCGGERAFAIPLNCYQREFDEDDKRIIRDYVKRFFESVCDDLCGLDDHVFVEMEE